MNLEQQAVSLKTSPVEIKNKEFNKTLWGYAPQQVIDFLDTVAKSWESVQVHERTLLEQIETLRRELQYWKSREEEFAKIRAKAEEDAVQIREDATREAESYILEIKKRAEELRTKTEKWLEEIFEKVEETEKKRESFVSDLQTSLDRHYKILEEQRKIPTPSQHLNHLINESTPRPESPLN